MAPTGMTARRPRRCLWVWAWGQGLGFCLALLALSWVIDNRASVNETPLAFARQKFIETLGLEIAETEVVRRHRAHRAARDELLAAADPADAARANSGRRCIARPNLANRAASGPDQFTDDLPHATTLR